MVLLWLWLAQATAAPPAVDAQAMAISAPASAPVVDGGKWKGEPRRLAWSPDQKELYLQFVEAKRGGPSVTHAVMTVATGALKKVNAEPAWASAYWTWKSGQASPARPAFRIAVEERTEAVSATATPMGGDLARGGADPAAGGISVDEVSGTYNQRQSIQVFELRLKGESLGVWKNEAVVPGVTFGWMPQSAGAALAFTTAKGELVLMDEQGRKKTVEGVSGASLPAWSDDGTRLAVVTKSGRRDVVVQILTAGAASR